MPQTGVDRFEQGFVFRFTRVLPLMMAGTAALLLVGAAIALAYSFLPTADPPTKPAVPPISVSRADVDNFIADLRDKKGERDATHEAASGGAQAVAAELASIRKRASDLQLPWANRIDRICKYRGPYTGSCLQYETVVTARGINETITAVLKPYDEVASRTETVVIDGTEYSVNGSHEEMKIAVLRELRQVFENATPDNSRLLLLGWAALREKKQDAVQEANEQNYRQGMKAYEEVVSRKQLARRSSLLSLALAIGSLLIVGLLLAILAIERHTRALTSLASATAAVSSKTAHV